MIIEGRNVSIGKNVVLGKNIQIGDNSTIFDNVVIGDNTIICSNCLIGEPQNSFYHSSEYDNPRLVIGANSLIRSNTVIYAGTTIGDYLQTGHNVVIRENNVLGNHCSVGVNTHIMDGCKIGNYVRFHSFNSLEKSTIGDFVHFYPFAAVTVCPYPPAEVEIECFVGDFTIISTHAVLYPGSYVGRHCLIGAQSGVKGKFEDFSLISGNPAKRILDLRFAPIVNEKTKRRHYPWPYNFDRGMPWKEMGFDQWLKENNRDL